MALQNGEIEFLLNHTHDNVISLMGGREKAHSYLMNFHKQMKAKNMDLGAITFPSEPIFISGTAHDFVIVQTKAMLALNNKDIKSLHFQFGAKKKGTKHWKYLDGSKLNKAVLKSWFPDFPKHTSLPKNIKEILQRA
jgi:hypothetical protein